MAKLRNAAPAFFVRNAGGRDGFHPTHRYSPLTELTLLRGSRLVPAEIRHRRVRETSVNRPQELMAELMDEAA